MTAVAIAGMLAVVVGLRWLPLGAAANDRDLQDVVLVVRDMAFHVAGASGATNPTLSFTAGSRVRVTLRNEQPGVTHNFAIPAWNVDTGNLAGPGEARIEFVVPHGKGLEGYQCTPHAAMMKGRIVVK
jgi:plastocyanin